MWSYFCFLFLLITIYRYTTHAHRDATRYSKGDFKEARWVQGHFKQMRKTHVQFRAHLVNHLQLVKPCEYISCVSLSLSSACCWSFPFLVPITLRILILIWVRLWKLPELAHTLRVGYMSLVSCALVFIEPCFKLLATVAFFYFLVCYLTKEGTDFCSIC